MPKGARKLTCEVFQSQLNELLNSNADAEDHPHLKTCATCRQLLRELEVIEDAARRLFPPEWSKAPLPPPK